MKKLVVIVVLVAAVMAVLCVPYCVREFKAADNATETNQVSPNLSVVERQRLLEQRVDALVKVIDQMQRENAQLRRDLDALSK